MAGGKGDLVTILPFTKDEVVVCTMATRLSQSCGLGLLLFEELVGGGSHRCRQWNGQGEKDTGYPPLRPHWLHHLPVPAKQPGRSGRWELAEDALFAQVQPLAQTQATPPACSAGQLETPGMVLALQAVLLPQTPRPVGG